MQVILAPAWFVLSLVLERLPGVDVLAGGTLSAGAKAVCSLFFSAWCRALMAAMHSGSVKHDLVYSTASKCFKHD